MNKLLVVRVPDRIHSFYLIKNLLSKVPKDVPYMIVDKDGIMSFHNVGYGVVRYDSLAFWFEIDGHTKYKPKF